MVGERDHEITPPKPRRKTKLPTKTWKEQQLHQRHPYEPKESPQNKTSRPGLKTHPQTLTRDPRAWHGGKSPKGYNILHPPHPKNCLPPPSHTTSIILGILIQFFFISNVYSFKAE
jgi:hypothetical protein